MADSWTLPAIRGWMGGNSGVSPPGKKWSINDFDLIKTVGTGFMGSVRVVTFKEGRGRTPFALKIMKKQQVIKRKQATHVMSERELLGKIEHPFTVKLEMTFQDNAHLYMLMEFVNGGELFNLIRRKKRLGNDTGKFYAAEIILAFGHLHSMDIVYRDLKPENVLLDSQGHVKVADFGFAKVVKTRTWTLCGTPEYLAPEVITIQGHSKPVDWWAMGVLIFEMLSGIAPFRGSCSKEIYQRALHSEPSFPSYFGDGARSIVKRLLEKD